jgi:ubiquinone/menaquinone biosynthesis C-methylase UbiE
MMCNECSMSVPERVSGPCTKEPLPLAYPVLDCCKTAASWNRDKTTKANPAFYTSDFAEQFPGAEVIGTDISPTQPTWVPPNLKFELDDAQLDWTFPDNHFDFIHMRLMMGSIKDWPALYKQIYRCLKPGGWFEHHDYDPNVYCDDGSVKPDSAWHQWGPIFLDAGKKTGRTFSVIIDHQNYNWMKDVGFENVEEKRHKLPLGGWAKDPKWKSVGTYNLVATEQGLEGFALYVLTQVQGWDLVQTQTYLASVRKELKSRSNHAYYLT